VAVQRRYSDQGPVVPDVGVQRSPVVDRALPMRQQYMAMLSDAIKTENENDPWTMLMQSLSAKHAEARERKADMAKYEKMLEADVAKSGQTLKGVNELLSTITGTEASEVDDTNVLTDVSGKTLYGAVGRDREQLVDSMADRLLSQDKFKDRELGTRQIADTREEVPEGNIITGRAEGGGFYHAPVSRGATYEDRVRHSEFVNGLRLLAQRGLPYQMSRFAERMFPGQGQDALDRAFKANPDLAVGGRTSNWAGAYATDAEATIAENALQAAALAAARKKNPNFLMEGSSKRTTSRTKKDEKKDRRSAKSTATTKGVEALVKDEEETRKEMHPLLRILQRAFAP